MIPENRSHHKKSLILKTWVRNNLLAGVAVLVPVLGTLWLMWWIVDAITEAGYQLLKDEAVKEFFWWNLNTAWARFLGRAFVLIVMIGLVILVGLFAKNFFGRKLLLLGEIIIERIPIINRIYVALKQISNAFWGQDKTIFREVVLIEYPRRGIYALGFVTSENTGEVGEKISGKLLNIFIPTTPNPTSGYFLMIPDRRVTHLDMTVEDGMKMVISGGAVMPEEGMRKLIPGGSPPFSGDNADEDSGQPHENKNIDSRRS